jgi:hypothetical protein
MAKTAAVMVVETIEQDGYTAVLRFSPRLNRYGYQVDNAAGELMAISGFHNTAAEAREEMLFELAWCVENL